MMRHFAERPTLVECDFCSNHVDRMWYWPTYPFSVTYGSGAKEGMENTAKENPGATVYWGACVFCRPLFESGDFRALAARVEIFAGPSLRLTGPVLERVYSAVHDAISGPVTEWHSGQARPVYK